MSTDFTELRSQSTQVDTATSAPTGVDLYEGRTYFDTSSGKLYVYVNGSWRYTQMTSTSTSSTSSSSSSSSTSSTSTSSTSTSSTSTSISTSSTSTSTTLY
ncbi:hypothetical protein M0R04_10535 [Candidatus Dojkabacteria bacterium]|nr:hypothetical protein [Candidatus Dojkabacteria bacterium]